ncbi:MAG: 50S ribosomal protein L22 [Actinomycetia bacterium]|nr:50S ribosomal protein L22 [Actinomycetes bacterium]
MAFGAKTNERPGTRAQLKHLRVSAYKAREVLNLIRGLPVDEAQAILSLLDRRVSDDIAKLLASAIANAGNNDDLPADELFISACYADEGATLRRYRPRARGRATRIRKRTTHITIIVSRLESDEIDRRRRVADDARSSRSGQGAADRSRRVAKSRGDEAEETTEIDEGATDSGGAEEITSVDEDATSETESTDESSDEAGFGAGSHPPFDDVDEMPEGFPIKGNADSMKYHEPGSSWYEATKAEVWFASTEAAEAAGFVVAGGAATGSHEESSDAEGEDQ